MELEDNEDVRNPDQNYRDNMIGDEEFEILMNIENSGEDEDIKEAMRRSYFDKKREEEVKYLIKLADDERRIAEERRKYIKIMAEGRMYKELIKKEEALKNEIEERNSKMKPILSLISRLKRFIDNSDKEMIENIEKEIINNYIVEGNYIKKSSLNFLIYCKINKKVIDEIDESIIYDDTLKDSDEDDNCEGDDCEYSYEDN